MNVIGIDYQRTITAACLREGHRPHWPPVSVGDGRRATINHVSLAGGQWNRDALACPPADAGDEDAFGVAESTTTGESAGAFWEGLSNRFRSFLGGMEVSRHVQRTVVALTTHDMAASAVAVAPLAEQAGFPPCVFIPSGRAVLLSALNGPPPGAGRWPDVIAIVVAADCRVGVYAYRLIQSDGEVRVTNASRAEMIDETGAALWIDEVLRRVRRACPEYSPDPTLDLALYQAAMELGWRLGAAAADEHELEWTGPLVERMPARPCFSRNDCSRWSSVRHLAEVLPAALLQACRSVGAEIPGAIVLAGLGAAWPFPQRIASGISEVLTVAAPELAAARGAAWWPQIGQKLFPDFLDDESSNGSSAPRARPVSALSPGEPLPLQSGFQPGAVEFADLGLIGNHIETEPRHDDGFT